MTMRSLTLARRVWMKLLTPDASRSCDGCGSSLGNPGVVPEPPGGGGGGGDVEGGSPPGVPPSGG